MLDLRLLRDETDLVKQRLATRGIHGELIDRILQLDERRRELLQQTEAAKARRNDISREIPRLAKEKAPIDDLKAESKQLGERITTHDQELTAIEADLNGMLLVLPNLPDPSVPVGPDESANVVLREHGSKPTFTFEPKPHWELGEKLGILDLPRGAKISGSGFYTMKGLGAKLERALIGWMLDTHVVENGYTEVSVPYIVGRKALIGTGQLPKFEDQLYRVPDEDLPIQNDLFLVPTAEVPVTNLHNEEILEPEQLPIAYCSHTPCFRREAGAAGRENRGISRVHQFHKVELVHICRPEESNATHERLVGHATALLEQLGLTYRVLSLCTGDMGFGAAICHDVEVWAPGMNTWLEVSSCSNFHSFQARRANIRYRPERGAKPQFVHTLNGSGLALPRLIIALLENYQQEDGTIPLPAVLHHRMGVNRLG